MRYYKNKYGYKQAEFYGKVKDFEFTKEIKTPTLEIRMYNEQKKNLKNLGAMNVEKFATLYEDYDVIMIYFDHNDTPIAILKEKRKEVHSYERRN